jgi:hypothetical protein
MRNEIIDTVDVPPTSLVFDFTSPTVEPGDCLAVGPHFGFSARFDYASGLYSGVGKLQRH